MKNSAKYCRKSEKSSCEVPVTLVGFNELEFSQQISGIQPKYLVSSKSVQWELSYSMRTDGHDEANRRFSKFCERA